MAWPSFVQKLPSNRKLLGRRLLARACCLGAYCDQSGPTEVIMRFGISHAEKELP